MGEFVDLVEGFPPHPPLGQRQARESAKRCGERDPHLRPGQRRANAVVNTVAKRDMARRDSMDVQDVQVVEKGRVAVGSGEGSRYRFTRRDRRSTDFDAAVILRGMELTGFIDVGGVGYLNVVFPLRG